MKLISISINVEEQHTKFTCHPLSVYVRTALPLLTCISFAHLLLIFALSKSKIKQKTPFSLNLYDKKDIKGYRYLSEVWLSQKTYNKKNIYIK